MIGHDGAVGPSQPDPGIAAAAARGVIPGLPSRHGVPPVAVRIARAIAPMHKRVMGLTVGIAAAASVWLLTMFHVLVRPQGGLPIELLAQIFYGFEVTWRGAAIGAWWAFVAGFVTGWFAAFVRNLLVAIWLTRVRIKAHLHETRGFLDQI